MTNPNLPANHKLVYADMTVTIDMSEPGIATLDSNGKPTGIRHDIKITFGEHPAASATTLNITPCHADGYNEPPQLRLFPLMGVIQALIMKNKTELQHWADVNQTPPHKPMTAAKRIQHAIKTLARLNMEEWKTFSMLQADHLAARYDELDYDPQCEPSFRKLLRDPEFLMDNLLSPYGRYDHEHEIHCEYDPQCEEYIQTTDDEDFYHQARGKSNSPDTTH